MFLSKGYSSRLSQSLRGKQAGFACVLPILQTNNSDKKRSLNPAPNTSPLYSALQPPVFLEYVLIPQREWKPI